MTSQKDKRIPSAGMLPHRERNPTLTQKEKRRTWKGFGGHGKTGKILLDTIKIYTWRAMYKCISEFL